MSKPKTAKRTAVAPPRRQAPPTVDPLMFTFDQTKAMLNCSGRQLKRWHLSGRIRATKPSGPTGPTFFTRAEIERCLREWSS